MKKPFKLAIIQMTVVGGDRDINLTHASKRIAEAATNGAQIILLPEAMDLGWTDPSALTDAEPIPNGKTSKFLVQMAMQHHIYICSGLIEKDENTVYNSAVLINPAGEIILHHRKINELDIGHPYYALGDRLNVVKTDLCTFGLFICADANTPDQVLTRSLAYMGADVILSPSSWAVVADHDNEKDPYGQLWKDAYQPVARDFAVWIISCSNVGWMTGGPWKGWKGIGCSLVVNHQGEVVLQGPYGEDADTIIYVDIQPVERPAQGTTWYDYWQKLK
ncbi:carbon-nitrogen hydrolase family protein [candidate division KSB1 bacterium]|nr:carbon-nitrogen hydrolase family protein [candidate division KSB1 bacterium]